MARSRQMNFTPGQAQEILGLSRATFRHWKGTLPPLAGRNGYGPCFTPGDLLALAVAKVLTDDIGIGVSSLYGIATSLFEHCQRSSWANLERSVLVIEPAGARVTSIPEAQPISPDAISIVLPWRPIIAALRERLLMEKVETPQATLRFPPAVVSDARRRGEAS
jgi:hypothetical protein